MSSVVAGSYSYSKWIAQPCAVTIGNFDGVHLGHQQLLKHAVEAAQIRKIPSCVFTFEPSPRTLLAPQLKTPRIMSWQERIEKILSNGIDYVIIEQFSVAFAQHPPEWFAQEIIGRRLQAQSVTVGYDFRYGRARAGTVEKLRQSLPDVDIQQIEAVQQDDIVISSSKIRELVASGAVEKAALLLGEPYSIRGVVVMGDQRGREMGFPTANVDTATDLLPDCGVYAVEAQINRGEWLDAMVNLGTRPTFGGRRFQIEVHIFNFSDNIYGDEISLRFHKRIRAEKRFSSTELLTTQLNKDMTMIHRYLLKKK